MLKVKVVDEILEKIWANQQKIYVFNKIDGLSDKPYPELEISDKKWNKLSEEEKEIFTQKAADHKNEYKGKNYLDYLQEEFRDFNPIFISASEKINLESLKEKIVTLTS
jgi:50S ribosomal subunit-associated GTPase HflX